MKIRFIGDVHGKWARYKKLIKPVERSLQVGDFGVGFRDMHGYWLSNPPYDAMAKGEHLFIRGNHDNPSVCRRHQFWIRDGSTAFDGRVFCVGGAESYDKLQRTEGLDWWPDEELTYRELNIILDLYEQEKPDVVVSHDASFTALALAHNRGLCHTPGEGCGRTTRNAFEAMLEIHRPKIWLNGHWHLPWDIEFKGTRFIGLPELGYIDLDIP